MNNQPKYTPGPWHVGVRQAEKIVYDSKGWAIANCTVYHGHEDVEPEVNARLIAAAPELLEACKLALKALDRYPEPTVWVETDILMTAIAKAEGRKS